MSRATGIMLAGNSAGKSEVGPSYISVYTVVESMTNWQRNQWARAGYPGLHEDKPLEVLNFKYGLKRGH